MKAAIVSCGLHLFTTPEEELDSLAKKIKTKWKVQRVAPDIAQVSRLLRD